jgi:hypothetical protein
MKTIVAALCLILAAVGARPVAAQDRLIFCNQPEKIAAAGRYADTELEAGKEYTVFYHYRNTSPTAGEFAVTLSSPSGFGFTARLGTADPSHDPPRAGHQAMARYFGAATRHFDAPSGRARFGYALGRGKVASGVLTVTPDRNVRLHLFFKHDQWLVRSARTIVVDAPRSDIEIPLSDDGRQLRYRIGQPEPGMSQHLDGTYGMFYAFKIMAPAGRRVRVSFSPRGGKAGLVGILGDQPIHTGIVPGLRWQRLCETTVGPDGVILTTAPFGGVFYPVELVFQLI